MDAIYEVHGLTKRYGRTAALNGVDFAVTPGKLVGLLGPNGSGKTTLMKISAGLLQPTAGSVIIDKVPVGVFTKAVTSYLPDRMALPTEFTADDAVSLYADFFTDFDKVKANAMLADLHIGGRDKIDSMSKGTQEKMQLCLTMSRAARLYLLDEPLGGVDPAALPQLLETAAGCAHIRVRGLMAIPPVAETSGGNHAYFTKMHELFVDIGRKKYDNVSMDFLSMGMSGDFEDAICAGANMVRVGSSIFGARDYSQH